MCSCWGGFVYITACAIRNRSVTAAAAYFNSTPQNVYEEKIPRVRFSSIARHLLLRHILLLSLFLSYHRSPSNRFKRTDSTYSSCIYHESIPWWPTTDSQKHSAQFVFALLFLSPIFGTYAGVKITSSPAPRFPTPQHVVARSQRPYRTTPCKDGGT